MQFSTCERRLEHVARINRALRLAGPHHGVDFVDENDGAPFVLGHFLEHAFEPLFKLATKFRAGKQQGHIQHQHALVAQGIGHFARHDALGKPFHDRRLAHSRFANQHRVVLGSALQHLDCATNFVVAANDGVELASPSALGEVKRVFFERLALAFRLGVVDFFATAHGINSPFQVLARGAIGTQQITHRELAVCRGQYKKLAGQELVAALGGFFFGGL